MEVWAGECMARRPEKVVVRGLVEMGFEVGSMRLLMVVVGVVWLVVETSLEESAEP